MVIWRALSGSGIPTSGYPSRKLRISLPPPTLFSGLAYGTLDGTSHREVSGACRLAAALSEPTVREGAQANVPGGAVPETFSLLTAFIQAHGGGERPTAERAAARRRMKR